MESRRHFVRNLLALALLAAFGTRLHFRSPQAQAQEPGPNLQSPGFPGPVRNDHHLVHVEKCDNYRTEEVYEALRRSLSAIGYPVPSGKKVLLKPNILAQNKPHQSTTTHPSIVAAACRVFAEKGCSVTIGESSAFYQGGGTEEGFVTSGMAEVANKYGAKLLAFEATDLRKITSGRVLNPFYLTDAVFNHDVIVNLPKLKVHRLARYTGALKNTYGCIPGGTKQLYHKLYQSREDYQTFWGKPLIDVYQAVDPHLVILDAIFGLDKDGPAANGEPRPTGVMLASLNGAALDIAACRMIGFDPLWVPAVSEAINRGMSSPDALTLSGKLPYVPYTKLPDLEKKTGLARKVDDYMFDQLIVTPAINKTMCNKCNQCIRRCAPQAISTDRNGFPLISLASCIRCYGCEKYCPTGAITLHGGGVNHLIRAVRVLTGI